MQLSYEVQQRVKELDKIQEVVREITSIENNRVGMSDFSDVKRIVIPLLEKYELQHIANKLNVEWPYVTHTIKDFSEEILFVLQSEI